MCGELLISPESAIRHTQGADQGDTTTIVETAIAAADQIEDAQAEVQAPQPLEEIIADKGYHSNQTMIDLEAVGVRSYVAEPDRGRRDWSKEPQAQTPVYANRRRIRGSRGRRGAQVRTRWGRSLNPLSSIKTMVRRSRSAFF